MRVRRHLLAALLLLGGTTAFAQMRVAIPGSLAELDLVRISAGAATLNGTRVEVGAFEVTRTEVTWDQYDVYALSTATDADRARGVDAMARPSKPYGAPDYGWGHSGFA